uniref:MFS domain-containing protein n=1 Tax=Macrostomum lignano TaxID=282301 RepID=A0A1I8HTA2_9PLAT
SVSINRSPADETYRWKSIRLCYLTFFISSLGFSICLSSIWPYLQQVDTESNEAFLGWVVAAFSLGQLIASPILGLLFNVMKQARIPILISLVISLFGSALYAYVHIFPTNRRFVLLVSRFVIGLGAGNGAVIRSFVSGATTVAERTEVMAKVSICQSLGFIVGPAVQAVFTLLGYPGPVHGAALQINMYTSAGLLSFLMAIGNIVLIAVFFKEFFFETDTMDRSLANPASINSDAAEQLQHQQTDSQTKPDTLAALICIFTFCVLFFNFSTLETIMTPLSQVMFAWNKEQASLYNGIALAVCGFISMVSFISIRCWTKISYFIVNGTASDGSAGLPIRVEDHSGGCSPALPWCYRVPAVKLPLAILAIAVHSVGYPIAIVLAPSVLTKILGQIRQGVWMGLLTGGGSLARCIGPIVVSLLFSGYGPQASFLTSSGLVLLSLIAVVAFAKRLVPFDVYRMRRMRLGGYGTYAEI